MSSESWKSYHRITRTATYGFLMALPLLVLYELMIQFSNRGRIAQIRVGAEVWIKQLLASFGRTESLLLAVIVVLVGIGILWYERKRKIPLRPRYFALMVGESALYAVLVALFVSNIVGMLFAVAPFPTALASSPGSGLQSQGLFLQLALSIGAGLYEELVFRVLLVGGLFILFKRVFHWGNSAYFIAAIIGAFLFSAVHYIGALGDAFTLPSFTFRFIFGLVLNVLFLLRGFGIAAWTHALYDVMVVTHFLG